ncbi:MAG: hypothetical protein AAGA37_19945 [Actinomycetota bacterium]
MSLYFKTTDAGELRRWRDYCDDVDLYDAKIATLRTEVAGFIGCHEDELVTMVWSKHRFSNFALTAGAAAEATAKNVEGWELPKGVTLDGRHLKFDKRFKANRSIAHKLDLYRSGNGEHAAPSLSFEHMSNFKVANHGDQTWWMHPSWLVRNGDTIYVSWSDKVHGLDNPLGVADLDVWEEIKASEWHLALEARDSETAAA